MEVEPPCDCLSLRRWLNVRLQHWQQHQHFNFYCRPTTCTVYEFVFASTMPNITLAACHILSDIKKQLAGHGCIMLHCTFLMFMYPGRMFWHFGRRRQVFRCALPTSQVAGITEASSNRGWFVYRTVSIKGVWFWPWWWCQIQWILQRNESGNGGCTGRCLGQLNSEGLFEGHFVAKIVPGT